MTLTQIETALAAEIIYNVDFVELKTRLNRLIEQDGRAASELYLGYVTKLPVGQRPLDELHDAYYGHPAAHTLKAFARKVPAAVQTVELEPARAAWAAIPVKYARAAELLAAAKDRVIKARKPSATPRKTPERTLDNTGTCACCGQNVKLSAGRIVMHGYTIRWGFQSGRCFGVGFPPIEVSPAGLDAAIASCERALGDIRLRLEYGPRSRKVEAELGAALSSLKMWTAARAGWAPRELPKAR